MIKRKFLCMLLMLIMIFCVVPTGAQAADGNNTVTIQAPAEATLFVGIKEAHYKDFAEVKPDTSTTEGGVTTYTFTDMNAAQVYNLRVTMEGKLTYVDYFRPASDSNFTFRAEKIDEVPDSDTVVTLTDAGTTESNVLRSEVMGADVYLNINAQGQLDLDVNETFRLRNYRVWQNITDGINNYFFEPDFHYSILSGSNVISFDESTMTIKGLQQGTAVMMVTYDAMEMTGCDYNSVTTSLAPPDKRVVKSAIWPENVGLFVIRVGSAGAVNTGIDWDAEHDSMYYLSTVNGVATGETNATYTFTPEAGSTVTVLRPTLNSDKTAVTYGDFSAEGVSTEGGNVTVTLNHGRNIIKVAKDGKASYQVMTARPLDLQLVNADGKNVAAAKPGEKITVKFSGISSPVYKMSGIYNPNTNLIEYPGGLVGANAGQYLSGKMTLDITIPAGYEDDTYTTLGTGRILTSLWGDNIGEGHRLNIGDDGRQANLSAGTDGGYFSVLPQFSFDISYEGVVRQEVTFDNFPEDGNLTIIDNAGAVQYSKNTVKLPAGTYRYTVGKQGYMAQRGTFTVEEEALTVTLDDMVKASGETAETAWDGASKTEPEKIDDVYQIGTGAELAWWADSVTKGNYNANAVLTADIDLCSYDWTAIETFNGTFDGNGHTIKNFYMYNTSNIMGLFKKIDVDAVVQNLTLEGEIILDASGTVGDTIYNQKKLMIGSIAAQVEFATVRNCHSDVDVTVSGELRGGGMLTQATCFIGGTFGDVTNSVIKDCTNNGDINITATQTGSFNSLGCAIGGVAGRIYILSEVENCGNDGDVTVTSLSSMRVGGVAGMISYNENIIGCYNKGNVTGVNYVGGLAGVAVGGAIQWTNRDGESVRNNVKVNVESCYNTGNVTATASGTVYAGGLVANLSAESGLQHTYTTGTVSVPNGSTAKAGVIAGNATLNNFYTSVKHNYYTAQDGLNAFGYISSNLESYGCAPIAVTSAAELAPLATTENALYISDGESNPFLYWEKAPNIVSLSVKQQPEKLNYYFGRSFEPDGMILEARDAAGKTYTLSSMAVSVTPETFTQSGTQKVTVGYGGSTTEVTVNVHEKGTAPAFIKLPAEKTLVFDKGTGQVFIEFEADGEEDVTYTIYSASEANGEFKKLSQTEPIIEFSLSRTNTAFYYVEATIGETVLKSDIYCFKTLDRSVSYTVTYDQPEHGKLIVTDGWGETIASGTQLYGGECIKATPQAEEGYGLKCFQVNNAEKNYANTIAVTSDTSIAAEFSTARKVIFDAETTDENGIRKGAVSVSFNKIKLKSGDVVGEGAKLIVSASASGSGSTYYYMKGLNVSNATLDETASNRDTITSKYLYYTVNEAGGDVTITPEYELGAVLVFTKDNYAKYVCTYDETSQSKSSGNIVLPAGTAVTITPASTRTSQYDVTGMTTTVAGLSPDAAVEKIDGYGCAFTTVAGNSYTVKASVTRFVKANITQPTNGTIAVYNADTGAEIQNGDKMYEGTRVRAEATPDSGYALVRLTCAGASSANNGIVSVKYSGNFNATFEKAKTITVKDYENGTVTVKRDNVEVIENGGTVGDGATIRINAVADEGYVLSSILVNGEEYNNNTNYKVTGNTNIRVVFAQDPATLSTVTYKQPQNGTLTVTDAEGNPVNSGDKVLKGTVLNISAAADEGYQVSGITVNDTELTDQTYTVTADETVIRADIEDGTIKVSFRLVGDLPHENGVEDHDHYVTWVPTTELTVSTTSGKVNAFDLFRKAMQEAGLDYEYTGGREAIRISSIQAPASLGDYWLGAKDNGENARWMYAIIQGEESSTYEMDTLSTCVLTDGQSIVLYYVDDAAKEIGSEENPADPAYVNRWMEAEDITPEAFAEQYAQDNAQKAKAAEDLIAAIGEVTLDSKNAIEAARTAYDALTNAQKALVANLDVLTAAEQTYAELTAAAEDEAAAEAVEALIAEIGEVTLDSKDAIEAARTAYDALTSAQKALVANLDVLTAAEQTYAELTAAAELPFTDVVEGRFYYDAVCYAYGNELIAGFPDNTFRPDDAMTRGQLVTILYRMEGAPEVSFADTFSDVQEGKYYTNAVIWASSNGIVKGYDDGSFCPDTELTREQIAVFLYRYASYKGEDVTAAADLSSYADAAQISSYASQAMQWANAEQLITGTPTGLKPADNATRAQVATILYRYLTMPVAD